MPDRKRVLIYSHDSFGLGHLRRCLAIANAVVDQNPHLSILLLSGSPIIGSFEFQSRVDFVRVPGLIKLQDGEYVSHTLDIAPDKALEIRAALIQQTAAVFEPHLFLVDKEPLGVRGEVRPTLEMLRARGVRLVLGLRDVMDDPDLLASEWARKGSIEALRDLYDEIWVYGLPQVWDPLHGLSVPASVRRKMSYTGYLRRRAPASAQSDRPPVAPYILVTGGGGGDGEELIESVIAAYERDPDLPLDAILVFGPFMVGERQEEFRRRVALLPKLRAITFDVQLEMLMSDSQAVVAMGGYNTFCEILSFDRPALIIPRTRPRMEQHIRAVRAQSLGLVTMLSAERARDPQMMATALRQLMQQSKPSDAVVPGLLDGLENVERLLGRALSGGNRPMLHVAES